MDVRVPGDKSISHRALLLAALAEGESRIRGVLPGADCAATAGVLRQLGVDVPELPPDGSEIRISGVGLQGLEAPGDVLDCGNSGTTARLLLGILSGMPLSATLTGDESLRSRPMRRVTDPLTAMGARFEERSGPGTLPITVHGGDLRALEYDLPVASAQVKSALLLAGVTGSVFVLLGEPGRSRDHTERMLGLMGCPVVTHARGATWRVELRDPPRALRPLDLDVPGDFSSAAFLVALAALGGAGDEMSITGVGLNPTRTGLLRVLRRMGVRFNVEPGDTRDAGEPSGTLVVAPGALEAVRVGGEEVPGIIDEIPVLAALAARARGETRIEGATELRVKESDRIRALCRNLLAVGVEAEELPDGIVIRGGGGALRGSVRTFGDHRIAMAFGVLATLPGNEIRIDDPGVADVSFPGFWELLSGLARSPAGAAGPGVHGRPGGRRRRDPVVTLDGPAGSGKSTTAKEVARRLGFRHLDSGALYRGLTWALLEAGVPGNRWPYLEPDDLSRLSVEVEPTTEGFSIRVGGRLLRDELRSPRVTERVSELARIPAVRDWLLRRQREAGDRGGLVADGRDMGTVVFPDAEVKVYLTADLEERARRRLRERGGAPDPGGEEVRSEAASIRRRDETDMGRDVAPLRQAPDAAVIDTTALSFEEQVEAILALVKDLTVP